MCGSPIFGVFLYIMKYSDEVRNWITEDNSSGWKSRIKSFKKYHPEWLEDMLSYEKNCGIEIESFQELIYCYMNNYSKSDVYCESGNKKNFRGVSCGYSSLCKEYRKCKTCSKIHNDRIKNTFKERYGTKPGFNNPAIKEKVRITNLKKYGVENVQQNSLIHEKTNINNAISSYKLKEYIMPSGKIEYFQGYENVLIDYLLDNGINETNIVINDDKIQQITGIIDYKLKRNRVYFPDLLVKNDKKYDIYEVKSPYTYKIGLDKGDLVEKMKACIRRGYDFYLVIVNTNKNIEKIYKNSIK